MTNYLNENGLKHLLQRLSGLFGRKKIVDDCVIDRQMLLEIDYDATFKFATGQLVGESAAPYVGQAAVGQTYVA